MIKIRHIAALAIALAAMACSGPDQDKKKPAVAAAKPTIRLTLVPQGDVIPGKPVTVLAKLTHIDERAVVTEDELATVHTQKFHLLVIDPSLTDYQHIHPEPTGTPGLYRFTFTPAVAGGYRAWADVTPVATGQQEFAMADLASHRAMPIDKTEKLETSAGGYHFTLSFDKAPEAGAESQGTIHISDAGGKPLETLQPVMGAYGHIVGFYDDYRTVVHTHPMGAEPAGESDRGGPDLTFHLAPGKAGFIKLFAQVRINGRDIFAPFGINVAKGS